VNNLIRFNFYRCGLQQHELPAAYKSGSSSFVSIMLKCNGSNALIYLDYTNSETIVFRTLINILAAPADRVKNAY